MTPPLKEFGIQERDIFQDRSWATGNNYRKLDAGSGHET
jgi:hypothetical protein